MLYLLFPGAAHRNDPNGCAAIGENRCPVLAADLAYARKRGSSSVFAGTSNSRSSSQREGLRGIKVDAVLFKVRGALGWVKFEVHGRTLG